MIGVQGTGSGKDMDLALGFEVVEEALVLVAVASLVLEDDRVGILLADHVDQVLDVNQRHPTGELADPPRRVAASVSHPVRVDLEPRCRVQMIRQQVDRPLRLELQRATRSTIIGAALSQATERSPDSLRRR